MLSLCIDGYRTNSVRIGLSSHLLTSCGVSGDEGPDEDRAQTNSFGIVCLAGESQSPSGWDRRPTTCGRRCSDGLTLCSSGLIGRIPGGCPAMSRPSTLPLHYRLISHCQNIAWIPTRTVAIGGQTSIMSGRSQNGSAASPSPIA
jgi:hypothetical protein